MPLDEESLREAARHRGLKLVKSRKRKPGVGDYGRFGLTDARGNPLLGIGDAGLTASAQEIADYLRRGEASTWAASAKVTLARAPQTASTKRPPMAPAKARSVPARSGARWSAPRSRPEATRDPPEPELAPKPALRIRTARVSDASAIASLLSAIGIAGTPEDVESAIVTASAREEPIQVADRGGVLGCLAWHLVPMVLGDPVARITALVVDERARREGIGSRLYEAAAEAFGRRGITQVEAMSDIALRNANGFYRTIGLEQTSYRFARWL